MTDGAQHFQKVTVTFSHDDAKALQSLAWALGLSNLDTAAAAIRLAGATLAFTMRFHGVTNPTGRSDPDVGG